MRRIITTQSGPTPSLEDLKDIPFVKDMSRFEEEPTISTEGIFDFFKDMFRSRIKLNPWDLEYSQQDLDKIRKALRKTVLDPKWLDTAKLSTAKFPHLHYFSYLSMPDKPFDFENPSKYVSDGLIVQNRALAQYVTEMEKRFKGIMGVHANLLGRWNELEQPVKRDEMTDAMTQMVSFHPTSKEWGQLVPPNVTIGGPTVIIPGEKYPTHQERKADITAIPALTAAQLPVVAEYILELVDTLAESDTQYVHFMRMCQDTMSRLPKSDQVLSWAYSKEKSMFNAYAPLIHYESQYDWFPNHVGEFSIMRILLSWVLHSVNEKH
jgi:hypothetical protein